MNTYILTGCDHHPAHRNQPKQLVNHLIFKINLIPVHTLCHREDEEQLELRACRTCILSNGQQGMTAQLPKINPVGLLESDATFHQILARLVLLIKCPADFQTLIFCKCNDLLVGHVTPQEFQTIMTIFLKKNKKQYFHQNLFFPIQYPDVNVTMDYHGS